MADEAKETQVVDQFDEQADKILDEQEKDTPSAPSTEEKPEEETSKEETTGTDQQKPEETKSEEEDIPKEFHKHPAWQKRIAKEKEAVARAEKAEEALEAQALSKEEVEDFRKTTSSPAYVREKMRAEGYKDEAIDAELKRLGHPVPVRPGDDLALITSRLGLDPATMNEDTKANLKDISKVVDVLIQDRLGKELPKVVGPLQDAQTLQNQRTEGDKLVHRMNTVVEKEGILDFKKDIQPLINKFIDENPNAQQGDLESYFKEVNHTLILERGTAGRKKTERDEKKTKLRQIDKTAPQNQQLKKTGDFDEDADALLDSMNV